MIASLMMYDRPEVATENAAYWALIRAALARRDIATPDHLSNTAPPFYVWRSPDLVFSQTCGMPYRLFLSDDVTLIGTPDFGIEGCAPGYYNSAVVVRADDPREMLTDFADARFAYNDEHSQSGVGAMYLLALPHGFWFANRLASGGHVVSARMVAEGAADIAAIDAQTWRMICRYDGFASGLRVLARTPATPSLPYITALGNDADVVFEAVSEAIAALEPDARGTLNLSGIVRIPKETYLAVENPPMPG